MKNLIVLVIFIISILVISGCVGVTQQTEPESFPEGPESFFPINCILAPDLKCTDMKVEPTKTTLVIQNDLGITITINNLKVGECSKVFSTELMDEEESIFTITGCNNGALKEVFRANITVQYTEKQTGIIKTAEGSIATRIGY